MRAKVVTLPYPVNTPAKRGVWFAPCHHAIMCMTHRSKDHGHDVENWELLVAHANKSRAIAIAARINRHA